MNLIPKGKGRHSVLSLLLSVEFGLCGHFLGAAGRLLQGRKDKEGERATPFKAGEHFLFLKRQFLLSLDSCDIRCDRKQYYGLEKDLDLFKKAYRKTPMDNDFVKKDTSKPLEGAEVTNPEYALLKKSITFACFNNGYAFQ